MKTILRYIGAKFRHRGAQVAYGATVARSSLGHHLRLRPGSVVSHCVVGNYVTVLEGAWLIRSRLGNFCNVGRNSVIAGATFGNFCSVGPEVRLGFGEHPTHLISTSPVFYSTKGQCNLSFADRDLFPETVPIEIGSDVWIGANVFIRDGVRVGIGAILAAGAVVARDVPEYAIAGGVPARVIRWRFPEAVRVRLLQTRWWDWSLDRLRQFAPLFAQPSAERFLDAAEAVSTAEKNLAARLGQGAGAVSDGN